MEKDIKDNLEEEDPIFKELEEFHNRTKNWEKDADLAKTKTSIIRDKKGDKK